MRRLIHEPAFGRILAEVDLELLDPRRGLSVCEQSRIARDRCGDCGICRCKPGTADLESGAAIGREDLSHSCGIAGLGHRVAADVAGVGVGRRRSLVDQVRLAVRTRVEVVGGRIRRHLGDGIAADIGVSSRDVDDLEELEAARSEADLVTDESVVRVFLELGGEIRCAGGVVRRQRAAADLDGEEITRRLRHRITMEYEVAEVKFLLVVIRIVGEIARDAVHQIRAVVDGIVARRDGDGVALIDRIGDRER